MSKNELNPSVIFNLDSFSGPLDLLLQLIRDNEMDIFQINISQITDQYISYLAKAPQPDLNRAGDFIKIASWLIYLKSRSLVPQDKKEEEEPDSKELQKKLSSLLAVYQKFQKLALFLRSQNILGRDCWKSAHTFQFQPSKGNKIKIDGEKALFQLIQAYYAKLLEQKNKKNYKVLQPLPSFLHHLKETAHFFKIGLRLKFSHLLLIRKTPYSFLLSFLSLLELSKSGFISLLQQSLFSNIDIVVKKPITKEALQEITDENTDRSLEGP